MQKQLSEIKNKIEWLEKYNQKLTTSQKEDLRFILIDFNNTLKRLMLTHLAVNKF